MTANEQGRLTIAIPTYNRNQHVNERLLQLLPLIRENADILILDNASVTPVSVTAEPVLATHPGARVRIVRNIENIGGSANIVRCLENIETRWMWLLGDDDVVVPDALQRIGSAISTVDEACAFIKFEARRKYHGDRRCASPADFVDSIVDWNDTLFMSTYVLNIALVRRYVKLAYHFGYSMAPHVALCLAALMDKRTGLIRAEPLISETMRASYSNYYSPLLPLLGRMTLLNLPLDPATRRRLQAVLSRRPSVEYVATYLTLYALKFDAREEAAWFYDTIVSRLYASKRAVSLHAVKLQLYRLLVQHPDKGVRVLRFAFRVLKRWVPPYYADFSSFVCHPLYERL